MQTKSTYHDDYYSLKRKANQSVAPMRYHLATPGPGLYTDYISNSAVRIQRWGPDMYNNNIDVESDLLGRTFNKPIRGYIGENGNNTTPSIRYVPKTSGWDVHIQSRDIMPAWMVRNKEMSISSDLLTKQPRYLFENSNIETRNIHKL